jgi:hypothetical protein
MSLGEKTPAGGDCLAMAFEILAPLECYPAALAE